MPVGEFHTQYYVSFMSAEVFASADYSGTVLNPGAGYEATRSADVPGLFTFTIPVTGLYKLWLSIDGNIIPASNGFGLSGGVDGSQPRFAVEASRQAAIFGSSSDLASVGIAAKTWASAQRTLSGFNFTVTAASVTDKTGYSLTPSYDPAKTAAQPSDVNLSVTVQPPTANQLNTAGTISVRRGDTLRTSLPPMGTLTGRTELVLTAKRSLDDSDDDAVIQITEAAGLVRLNGIDAAGFSTAASLTVVDASTGDVDIEIQAIVTAGLLVESLHWDAQFVVGGETKTPIGGTMVVNADVTRRHG